ncbi:MAG TPA: hypothetical protein PLQ96_03765, partial [Bacillota bacterium]|nr:hypothetical protein [Bacillota bacterium]
EITDVKILFCIGRLEKQVETPLESRVICLPYRIFKRYLQIDKGERMDKRQWTGVSSKIANYHPCLKQPFIMNVLGGQRRGE